MMIYSKNSFLNDFTKNGKYVIFNGYKFGLVLRDNSTCNLVYYGNKTEKIKQLGFKKYADEIYILETKQSEIKSAFHLQTFCIYQHGKYGVENIVRNVVIISPELETKQKLGLFWKDDRRFEIPYDDFMQNVEEIWEERSPIEGFVFDVEPIYYIYKKSE